MTVSSSSCAMPPLRPPFAARRPVYLLVEVGSDETDPTDDLASALDAARGRRLGGDRD